MVNPRRWFICIHWMYLCLCLRFEYATFVENAAPVAVLVMFFCVGVGMSIVLGDAALFGVTAVLPLLLGLNYSGLLTGFNAPMFLLSAMSLGSFLRGLGQSKTSPTRGSAPMFLLLATDVLASAVVISMLAVMSSNWSAVAARRLLTQAVFGYADRYYFITSAFLWLTGIYYFERLVAAIGGRLQAWATPIFSIYSLTAAVFIVLQLWLGIPIPLSGYAYYSPFDDISSFGSVASCLFVFTATTWKPVLSWSNLLRTALILALLAMVALSWSRAAWLSTVVFILAIAYLRLPLRWNVPFYLAAVIGILFINLNAKNPRWSSHPYLNRLVALGRVENPTNKSPERMMLYHRAFGMIKDRPLTGHGIGSFYLKSVPYAAPGDPRGAIPDFAHDVVLQIASELGIPVGLLFVALIIVSFLKGLKDFRDAGTNRTVLLGSILALGCYLLTQVTANSLNVYISNQIIFWLLAATIVSSGARHEDDSAPVVD